MRRIFLALIALVCVVSVTVAQAERSVIVAGNGQLVTELSVFSVTETLNDTAFSPDSRFLAVVGDDTALRILDIATGEIVAEAFEHFSFVQSVAWTDSMLITGSWDRSAIVWDVTETGMPAVREAVSSFDAVVDVVEPASDDEAASFFMGVGDGKVRMYNTVDKAVSQTWSIPALQVTTIAVSPDMQNVVTAGGFPTTGAQLWDIQTSSDSPIADIPYAGTILAATYIDAGLVALGGDDGTVMLWDVNAAKFIATLQQNDWVIDLALSPDKTVLAVARQDGVLTLWDITIPAQSELIVAIVASDSAALTSVDFSPDGRLIATTDDEGVARLWGVEVK